MGAFRRVVGPVRSGSSLMLLVAALAVAGAAAPAQSKLPPLKDPVFLNIGFICKWQTRCIKNQQRAMKRSLHYVKKYRPPAWKIQLCNRNASRRPGRVDWIGYYNCLRNTALRPPPPRRVIRRRR